MDINLDDLYELWPPTSELVGLQFETDADFARCEEIRWQHLDMFCLKNPDARYVVVPKTEVRRFAKAGLAFQEVELEDWDTLPPEERSRREYALIHSEPVQRAMKEMLERLARNRG
ncbi:MAG TPA: hypothetical protein VK066_20485 [Chloroflexota bacterium]|nr:hypothetical protein [Chloroflexota bacterium]